MNANHTMELMEAAMCTADEFEPDDTLAWARSIVAKAHATAARRFAIEGNDEAAIIHARDAIRILEGN